MEWRVAYDAHESCMHAEYHSELEACRLSSTSQQDLERMDGRMGSKKVKERSTAG